MEQDMQLKANVERMFIRKPDVDIYKPSVMAAVITAASAMSRESEVATPEMTTEELLDLYGVTGDGKVTSLLGMQSSYIQLNTGYSVIVEDMGSASINYQAQKESYDALYGQISERSKERLKESGKLL